MRTGVLFSHVGGRRPRLAAILCVDIEDYSRLFGIDEDDTGEHVERHRREVVVPSIVQHDGRVIEKTGEGFLAVFDNPLAAVRCAMAIRQVLIRRNTSLPRQPCIQCRVGIGLAHARDIADGIQGNGVTIAARLHSLAEPGTVYISGGVYERVKNRLGCGFRSLGVEKIEEMADPVRIYSVLPGSSAAARPVWAGWMAYAIAIGVGLAIGGAVGWYRLHADNVAQVEKAPAATLPSPRPPRQPAVASVLPPEPPEPPEPPKPPKPLAPVEPPVVAPAPARLPEPLSERGIAAPVLPQAPAAPPAATLAQAAAQLAAVVKPPPLGAIGAYEVFRECGECPEMVGLPGDTFAMGSNDDPTEQPVFRVTVPPFALGRRPVTVGEWKRCVAAKACAYEPSGEDEMPVHNLSWNDAQQYVAWLSSVTASRYRLPTEAEWEYAARGGKTTRYWWGNQLVAGKANCKGCGEASDLQQPMKAGSFAPNPFGLYDMAGGVTQWVSDCWHKNYRGAPTDGSAWDTPNCRERVLRGGSWRNGPDYSRASSRDRYDAGVRYLTHGLRVARSGSN
jgi:formylglycine-generating enzyme required for sulfatase activity/class 3 adenylate cyclase